MSSFVGIHPLLDVVVKSLEAHVFRHGDGAKTALLALEHFLRQMDGLRICRSDVLRQVPSVREELLPSLAEFHAQEKQTKELVGR